MNAAERRRAVARLLASSLRARRRHLLILTVWSAVEAVPLYLSGRLVALAMDQGFLVHRVATGLSWLGLLAAATLVGALATRQVYRRLAPIVEPLRDDLAALVVDGALRRSTSAGAPADTAGVARLTQHVEIVREATASSLLVIQGFVVSTAGAVMGLLSLTPLALVLVLPPVVV